MQLIYAILDILEQAENVKLRLMLSWSLLLATIVTTGRLAQRRKCHYVCSLIICRFHAVCVDVRDVSKWTDKEWHCPFCKGEKDFEVPSILEVTMRDTTLGATFRNSICMAENAEPVTSTPVRSPSKRDVYPLNISAIPYADDAGESEAEGET